MLRFRSFALFPAAHQHNLSRRCCCARLAHWSWRSRLKARVAPVDAGSPSHRHRLARSFTRARRAESCWSIAADLLRGRRGASSSTRSCSSGRAATQTAAFLDVFRKSSRFSEVQAVCGSLAASPLVGLFQAGYAELNAQLRGAGETKPGAPAPRPTLRSLEAVDRALLRASTTEVAQARASRARFSRRRRRSRRTSACSARCGGS